MPQPSDETGLVIVAADPRHRVLDAALAAGHPADVVGVHFVEAGNGKPGLAELVLPDVTAAATAAKAAALAARIGLTAVISGDRPGFLIEALAYAQFNNAVRMFQDGYASPADIDTAMMLGCGYPRGPLQMLDEAGAAHVVSVLDAMHAATGDPAFTPVPLLAEYATAGSRFRAGAEVSPVSIRPERDPRTGNSLEEFQRDLADNLCYERGTTAESASAQDAYWTLAMTIRDRLADRRARTARANYLANPKFVYYLSAEYMLGRQLRQNAVYTGTDVLARQAVAAAGFSAWDLESLDVEPGLGNGGLGRLAACLLDSLATLDMPAVGYGIRYEFGIFKQAFEDGYQVEQPDDWTFYGNPWEFPAPDDLQVVGFYGHTEPADDDPGGLRARWVPAETVRAEPSHMLVPGYGTETVNILRLWRARAGPESFDLDLFNAGRYAEAVEAQMRSENLTKVLYPERQHRSRPGAAAQAAVLPGLPARCGTSSAGSGSATATGRRSPDKVVIQLNDTHPVLAIPELMRLLVDENGVGWDQAWSITRRTFAYTCHTLLPEALETWPVRACSGGCYRATWRSSTPSTSLPGGRARPATRATTSASPGCR